MSQLLPTLRLSRSEDRIDTSIRGSNLVLDVESVSGIGGLRMTWGQSPRWSRLVININLRGLESMKVVAGNRQLRFSLPYGDRYPTPWEIRHSKDVDAWRPLLKEGVEAPRILRRASGVSVQLPIDGWDVDGMVVEWVDFYR
ncbi:hypothetical protein [Aestuariirhabdus sp. LZHN29]|uniref:hypothetical protein n=1 Tax=Aestuariirhabdus sp. LZHN29 TaxID=3417462 RepID=UPI003CF7AD26